MLNLFHTLKTNEQLYLLQNQAKKLKKKKKIEASKIHVFNYLILCHIFIKFHHSVCIFLFIETNFNPDWT